MIDLAILGIKIDPVPAQVGGRAAGAEFDKLKLKAETALNRIDNAVNGVRSSLFNMRNAVLGLGSAFAATQGIRVFADFERQMSSVRSVLNGTEEDMVQLTRQARQLGASTEFTATQSAEAMDHLAKAGLTANQIMAAMPATLDLAMAAQVSLGQASQVTANIMAAFGKRADQVREIGDVLAFTANRTQTDISGIGEAMKYVGPIAATLGVSLQDTAAAIGVLSNAGLQGSMAGTGLRRIISSLASATPMAKDAIESLGLTLQDVNPQTNSLSAIVTKLSLAGLDAGKAFDIFGDRGAQAILALTAKAKQLEDLNEQMGDLNGSSARVSRTLHDNLQGDFKAFTSAVQEATLAAGDGGLLGGLRNLLQTATGVVNVFSGMADPLDATNKKFFELAETLKVLGAVAAGFIAMKMATYMLDIAVGTFQLVKAMSALNVVMTANPVGLVAAGIGLLTGLLIANSLATTDAERKQSAYNKTLQEWVRVSEMGKDAGEASVKNSMKDLTLRSRQAEAELHGIEARIQQTEVLAKREKELQEMQLRVDPDPVARRQIRAMSPHQDRLQQLYRERDETKAAYDALVRDRKEAEGTLESIQLDALERQAGISAKLEAEYQRQRNTIIEKYKDADKQAKMLAALDERFQKIKSGQAAEPPDTALADFARGLNVATNRAREYEQQVRLVKLAKKELLITDADEAEALAALDKKYKVTDNTLTDFVNKLDVASVREREYTQYVIMLDQALRAGQISQEDYNEAIAKAGEELEAAKGGLKEFAEFNFGQLQRMLADEQTTAERKVRIREEMNRRLKKTDIDKFTAFKMGVLDEMETWGSAAEQMVDAGRTLTRTLVSGIEDFAMRAISNFDEIDDAFRDLAGSILREMARIIIHQAIARPLVAGLFSLLGMGISAGVGGAVGAGPGGAVVGDFGSGFSGSSFASVGHTGGIIGQSSLASRSVNMGLFSDAPRFHTGGIVGGEVPIIAQEGEGVFTKEQMRALGERGGGGQITVNNYLTVNRDGGMSSQSTVAGGDAATGQRLMQNFEARMRSVVMDMMRPGQPLYAG